MNEKQKKEINFSEGFPLYFTRHIFVQGDISIPEYTEEEERQHQELCLKTFKKLSKEIILDRNFSELTEEEREIVVNEIMKTKRNKIQKREIIRKNNNE